MGAAITSYTLFIPAPVELPIKAPRRSVHQPEATGSAGETRKENCCPYQYFALTSAPNATTLAIAGMWHFAPCWSVGLIDMDAGMPKTILLVEDDSALRQMLSSILQIRGFTMLQAENGRQALEIAANHGGPIHFLISDSIMPELNGPALAEQLLTARPRIRVILMSGDDESDLSMMRDGWTFIKKPFLPTALVRTINDLLIRPSTSSTPSNQPILDKCGTKEHQAAAILENPAPGDHMVFCSGDDVRQTTIVTSYASSGLKNGEAVILIVTEKHWKTVVDRLRADAYDVEQLEKSGQLVFLDAMRLLEDLMTDGMPSPTVFSGTIGWIIRKAGRGFGAKHSRGVRVFGEMVSLVWRDNPSAALRLEVLWNELIRDHSIPLLCSYTLDNIPAEIACLHSHTIAA